MLPGRFFMGRKEKLKVYKVHKVKSCKRQEANYKILRGICGSKRAKDHLRNGVGRGRIKKYEQSGKSPYR